MKNLRTVGVSAVLLVVMVGVILPIFKAVQEERVYLAYTKLMESDSLGVKSPNMVLDARNEQFQYLMKHPRQTLKNCLQYEADNPEESKLLLNTALGTMAYQKISKKQFTVYGDSLSETVKMEDHKLYIDLTEK